jgi:hypothetical protein
MRLGKHNAVPYHLIEYCCPDADVLRRRVAAEAERGKVRRQGIVSRHGQENVLAESNDASYKFPV